MPWDNLTFVDLLPEFLSDGFSYNKDELEDEFLKRGNFSESELATAKIFFQVCDPNIESLLVPFHILADSANDSAEIRQAVSTCIDRKIMSVLELFTDSNRANLRFLDAPTAEDLLRFLQRETNSFQRFFSYRGIARDLSRIASQSNPPT